MGVRPTGGETPESGGSDRPIKANQIHQKRVHPRPGHPLICRTESTLDKTALGDSIRESRVRSVNREEKEPEPEHSWDDRDLALGSQFGLARQPQWAICDQVSAQTFTVTLVVHATTPFEEVTATLDRTHQIRPGCSLAAT